MNEDIAVGIDLGTTYSVVARVDASGCPETLVNAEGDRITPSVVLFDGQDVIVGKEALKAIATEAPRVAECSKRDVGHQVFHKVIGGKSYPPEVIEAWILNKLRLDASAQIGPVRKAVITVPAYFDEVRRKATQDAGYMAGLEVLDIINEPTAAAVAYGYQKGFLEEAAPAERPMRILVYDLGGGTFDVTVMEIRGNQFITLATDGDVRLGGHDWDERLVDLVADAFVRKAGIDPREDPAAAGRLWLECEDAKRTLSARHKVTIACHGQGQIDRVEVSQEQFQEATADLLDRTRFTVTQALAAARLRWDQIDRLLLVGGSTRMPMVRDMLRDLSGLEPDGSVAADEAVAQGAAIRAAQLVPRAAPLKGQFIIKNVNSHSLGVVGTDRATGRRRNGILIPRNTPIPVVARRVFQTQKDNQRSILVQVVEGESASADECNEIGKCSVRQLPPGLPAGSPVEVRFQYQPDGRLGVRVSVPDTSAQLETVFARENTLTQKRLDDWRRHISDLAPAPRK